MKRILAAALIAAVLIAGCIGQSPAGTVSPSADTNTYYKGLDVTFLPAVGGTVTVKVNSVPLGSGKLTAVLTLSNDSTPIISQVIDPDTMVAYIDTTKVADGTYNVTVFDEYDLKSPPGPWLARVSAQITVKNPLG